MLDKGKSRSLAQIGLIFGAATRLEEAIRDLLKIREQLDVLEIGFGYGRALVELAWHFRRQRVTFHGVNLKPKAPVETREDLREVARHFNLIPQAAIPSFGLPQVYFHDATQLQFDDESIDLLYSAVTIRFIERKAEFLEEVGRVLKPAGRALLHISETNWHYPYSVAADNRILTPYTNRFVLRYGNELIPLPDYVKLFEGDRFRFHFTTDSRCILQMSKLTSGHLSLQLDYNRELSMSGYELPLRSQEGDIRGGFRSVYDVRPEWYRALFERGFLSRDRLRTDIMLSPGM